MPAIGSVVVVRDEEWLVETVGLSADGWRLTCRGLSELVRDTTATFLTELEPDLEVLDPANARMVADDSPGYRRSRLWVEAMLRKTPVPLHTQGLTVAHRMLLDPLTYQRKAVMKALSLQNLRPRLLIADAVGLGKTLEIGMVISELARRGRAERILVVTPRHVLEQMQRELWARFAIPLIRLDSAGIQRIRQELPATRNPFTYYPKVIVSVDTLKSDRYRAHLTSQRWDVVVIDESHNLTNTGTQNYGLARTLAPNTEALLLASATPHNGKPESFATLIDLLDPTAIVDPADYTVADIARLFIRRHRHSPDVEREVGHHWAERGEPRLITVGLTPAEEAIVDELWQTWLAPNATLGTTAVTRRGAALFPWTLAKAFLSSPQALAETARNRRATLARAERLTATTDDEQRALVELEDLAAVAIDTGPAKLDVLVDYLRRIGVGRGSDTRVVCFSERLATLAWLEAALPEQLGLPAVAVAVLQGNLPDDTQQAVIESFGLTDSPIRVLLAGDMASEGINLHQHCHHLVHIDLPWSLIRIEQRNGRIDRYGQTEAPQIAALLATSSHGEFSADVRVLTRLLAKEDAAHRALGDAASLMRLHDVGAEEEAVARALDEHRDLDEVVPDPRANGHTGATDADDAAGGLSFEELFSLIGEQTEQDNDEVATVDPPGLFRSDLEYLREALAEVYPNPSASVQAGGVGWKEYPDRRLVELTPPPDLRSRLAFLPQDYVAERGVRDRVLLATSTAVGEQSLIDARRRGSESLWPQAHYLSPLHPVLEWATARALARLQRGEVPAVRGDVLGPTVLVQGVLHNARGQVLLHTINAVTALDGPGSLVVQGGDGLDVVRAAGIGPDAINPADPIEDDWDWLIPQAVERMGEHLAFIHNERITGVVDPLRDAAGRIRAWRHASEARAARSAPGVASRIRRGIEEHGTAAQQLAQDMLASGQSLIRPLLVILPTDGTAR
ncbi:MAG: DEAD/DEAH box helicase [Kineosporiaceae bacterium]|nr:DEAD/DEAH box helicase [Kineosporiaceae bacterium]